MKRIILNENDILITKSKYTLARTRDSLAVWLGEHQPESAGDQDKISFHLMEEGKDAELKLTKNHSFFKNGYNVSSIQNQRALDETFDAIERGEKIIYQAALYYDQMFIRVDILKFNEESNEWEIFEVKASKNEKNKRKEYVSDLSIQKWVGMHFFDYNPKVNLVMLNDYTKDGEINYDELFKIIPYDTLLHEEIKILPNFVQELIKVLENKNPPIIQIGSQCKSPDCNFKDHCWKHIKSTEGSIEELSRLDKRKRKKLNDLGFKRIQDIDDIKLFGSSKKQKIQYFSYKKDKIFLDKASLLDFLDQAVFPLYFLDFETYIKAIPQYNGMKPLEQTVFQISLHIVKDKESWDKPEHYEYLAEHKNDPRLEVLSFLENNIPQDGGSVVVYHQSFEKSCLEKLKNIPNISDKSIENLDNMVTRLYDLEVPFSKTYFYHKNLKGSSSIKKVFPLFEEKNLYESLIINNGSDAQYQYIRFLKEKIKDPNAIKNLFKNLKDYCFLDTMAMVVIMKNLFEIVNTSEELYWFEEF